MKSPFKYLPYNMRAPALQHGVCARVRASALQHGVCARVRACVLACAVEIKPRILCSDACFIEHAFGDAYGLPYKMVPFIAKKGVIQHGLYTKQKSFFF